METLIQTKFLIQL